MLRLISLLKVYRAYGISMRWIAATPYGFWYLAEKLLGTSKYTEKSLNSLLLFPVPVLNLLAIASYCIRYHRVKIKCLRALHYSNKFSYLALVPLAFHIILLKGRL